MAQHQEITTPERSQDLNQALLALRSGGVIVLPTDTLYGLGASVFDEVALGKVFAIKGRPAGMALPVLVNGWEMAQRVSGEVSAAAQRLTELFWPGPLTLVVPSGPNLSDLVTGGGDTVGLRSPDHWVPQELIGRLGSPITGTSANRSGGPDLKSVTAVWELLGGEVDYIVQSGQEPQGTASTVVEIIENRPRLIREGAIPFKEILRAAGIPR